MIKMETVVSDDEMIILAFMVMNDDVAQSALRRYKSGELKTRHFSEYFRPVFRALIKYIGSFGKGPRFTVETLFNKMRISDEERDVVGEYLERIAAEYSRIEADESVEPEYVSGELIPDFIREQEGRLLIEKIETAIDSGRIYAVDEAIDEYTSISEEEWDNSMGATAPFSQEAIESYYAADAEDKIVLRLDGPIGAVIPPLCRKKLTAITGVEKSGKTTWMGDLAWRSIISSKAKVLWINCEMDDEDLREYFWRRLTQTASDKEHAGRRIFPVFDCLNNQLDRCEIMKRSLNGGRLFETGKITTFTQNRNWKICTKCRNQKTRFQKPTKIFIPAIWFDQIRLRQIRRRTIARAISLNRTFKLNRLRIKTFPRLAVKFTDVERFITGYMKRNSFKPDLLVLDYPDIIAPEEGKLLDRQNVDFIWKKCAGLTHELDCATLVADQATKAARSKRNIERDDTSESKTKDAHLDVRVTLNMTDEEEEIGIQRIGILYRRKGKRTTSQVMVTQRKESGEVMLDNAWWNRKDTSYPVRPSS
jgi:hypothetical protein